jgi:hypothetical protein
VAKILAEDKPPLQSRRSEEKPATVILSIQYRVKVPFTGFLFKLETESSSIVLPSGAILYYLPISNRKPLLGMARVLWQGREYSIFEKELREKCETSVDLRRSV